MHLTHKRAERLTQVHNTNSQYNPPAIGKKIVDKANRAGVAARCADLAGGLVSPDVSALRTALVIRKIIVSNLVRSMRCLEGESLLLHLIARNLGQRFRPRL